MNAVVDLPKINYFTTTTGSCNCDAHSDPSFLPYVANTVPPAPLLKAQYITRHLFFSLVDKTGLNRLSALQIPSNG